MDTPSVESDTFATIGRINNKIESLRKVLSSVISELPVKVQEGKGSGTRLSNELYKVEDDITNLLASIRL